MDNKKKFVIIISIMIGAAFLYVGFNGLKQNETDISVATDETVLDEPVDDNSANALDNIAE